MPRTTPRPLTAARVLLWGMAGLLLFSALSAVLRTGGSVGVGVATVPAVLAILCATYAYLLPRTGHIVLGIVVTLLVLMAFYQVNRITLGDPLGFLGFGFCVALTVLLLLPSSRAALRP
ncbi:hypothetical protein F4561_005925 [Lipingzhangella halophila]|uniref:Uncharacterized protein n=1 Tax=Lipingzhangella halophila TaxID=1783352 RepID=A0A7W7RN56_9ACTN|nr:hypothetical protein [Lipingzhangella halophila]MBB4935031.1 hypothetical protein [Lipingzhangella halophila]